MPFTFIDTGRGEMFDANGAKVHIEADNPITAPAAERLRHWTAIAAEAEKTFRPEVLGDHLANTRGGLLFGMIGDRIAAARRERAEVAERDVVLFDPTTTDHSDASHWWSLLRDRSAAEKATILPTLPLAGAAAVTMQGNPAALPDELLPAARHRFAVEKALAQYRSNGSFQRVPTLDDVSAVGWDDGAARAAAEGMLEQHAARVDRVQDTEATLKALIAYAAASIGIRQEQALERSLAHA